MTNRLSRLVFSNPTFFERFRGKLAELLANEYTEEKLFEKIDAFSETPILDLKHYIPHSDAVRATVSEWLD